MLDLEDWPDLRSLHKRTSRPVLSHEWMKATTALWTKARDPAPATSKRKISRNPCPPGQLKRCRQIEDVEGDHTAHLHRKKRRLRLALTTSRLSEPFATSSTFIAGRSTLREGTWARQRVAGRGLLRKAAILNLIARKGKNKWEEAATRHSAVSSVIPSVRRAVSVDCTPATAPTTRTRPRKPLYSPQASTFSEYDVLDYDSDSSKDDEDEDDDDDDDDDDEKEEEAEEETEGMDSRSLKTVVHSDFSKLRDYLSDAETSMQEYAFDSTSSLGVDEIYTFDPGGKAAMGFVFETETKTEVSYAPRMN